MTAGLHADTLAAVEQLLNRGAEADEVLRDVVGLLHERLGLSVRLRFVEEGELVAGPAAGEAQGDTTAFPIGFEGAHVADLEAGGPLSDEDRALLTRVATLLAPYALVGWDTGGETWEP